MSFWRDRRVLLTGAGGFVGSWLCREMVERGAEVVCLIRDRKRSTPLRLWGLEERVHRVGSDLSDLGTIERTVAEYEVEVVFHLAAQAIVGTANRSPLSTFETNVRGTWLLLEACRRSPGVICGVVASSDKAYGASEALPYTESTPLAAIHPYDVSKACADLLTRSFAAGFDLPFAVTRMANLYGPGDFHASRLIPGTIRLILRGENPVLRGDGSSERDYLYVADAVAGYLRLAEGLAEVPSLRGEAFNFGWGRPVSALEIVERLIRLSGDATLKAEIRGAGNPVGEIDRQALDAGKARRLLGWTPTVTLEEGLKRTLDDARAAGPSH